TAKHRRRNSFDLRAGSSELERVAVRRVAPRYAEIGFDTSDDFACHERGHQIGLQYGSPTGIHVVGSSGTMVLTHCAHTFMPGSSETTRPRRMRLFFSPAVTLSRAYSTDSHSRTSPAMTVSTLRNTAS